MALGGCVAGASPERSWSDALPAGVTCEREHLTRRAARLAALGIVLPGEDACASQLEERLTHPYLLGALGDLGLYRQLQRTWDHRALLAHEDLLTVLGAALGTGRITGYDLRPAGVYDGFPSGHTLVYSHSSPAHLQQLVTLLAGHGLHARVYQVPKVSAFVYRDGWGGDEAALQTLGDGVRVVRGREVAVLFEFARAADRAVFHDLVVRYAKRERADQESLIVDAWWQPFYYTDAALEDFVQIGLVVLHTTSAEATLTVTLDKLADLSAWAEQQGFAVRSEGVWVNPSFHRFLQGDYK